MLKKLAAIGLTIGALVLAAPAAANAASATSDSYTGTPSVSVDDAIIDTCEASTIVFGPGYFQPSETVGISVSGLHAADAAVSGNTAAADGSMVVTFRPPSDGEGSYAITFARSQASGAAFASGGSAGGGTHVVSSSRASGGFAFAAASSYTATITVSTAGSSSCRNDSMTASASKELPLTGGGIELALTGTSVSPWLLGGGAVALVAGGALVMGGIARRKNS